MDPFALPFEGPKNLMRFRQWQKNIGAPKARHSTKHRHRFHIWHKNNSVGFGAFLHIGRNAMYEDIHRQYLQYDFV
jgi:hypothetical protein